MPKRYSAEGRQYSPDDLEAAVKARRLSTSKAAAHFKVPRKNLDDHVKGRVTPKPPGPSPMLKVYSQAVCHRNRQREMVF